MGESSVNFQRSLFCLFFFFLEENLNLIPSCMALCIKWELGKLHERDLGFLLGEFWLLANGLGFSLPFGPDDDPKITSGKQKKKNYVEIMETRELRQLRKSHLYLFLSAS